MKEEQRQYNISELEANFNEIQDFGDQLAATSALSYDREFHEEFTRKYSGFIRDLLVSGHTDEIKEHYMIKIQTLLTEILFDITNFVNDVEEQET